MESLFEAFEVVPDRNPAELVTWPSDLKTRARAVRTIVTHAYEPLNVERVAQHFHRARRSEAGELLDTLSALGLWGRRKTGRTRRESTARSLTSTTPVALNLIQSSSLRRTKPIRTSARLQIEFGATNWIGHPRPLEALNSGSRFYFRSAVMLADTDVSVRSRTPAIRTHPIHAEV